MINLKNRVNKNNQKQKMILHEKIDTQNSYYYNKHHFQSRVHFESIYLFLIQIGL